MYRVCEAIVLADEKMLLDGRRPRGGVATVILRVAGPTAR